MDKKYKIIIFSIIFSFTFLTVSEVLAVSFTPQVSIPGSEWFKKGEEIYIVNSSTALLGQYIQSIYAYAISIVGIVATIMLMFGGFTWLTAGGSGEKVGKARDIIFSSLTGLVLALTSYTILTMINPNLVNFTIQEINSPSVKNK